MRKIKKIKIIEISERKIQWPREGGKEHISLWNSNTIFIFKNNCKVYLPIRAKAIIAEANLECAKKIETDWYIHVKGNLKAREILAGSEIKVKGSIRVKGKLISQKYIEAGKDIEGQYIESGRGYNIIASGEICCKEVLGRIWEGTLVLKSSTAKIKVLRSGATNGS